MYKYIFLLLAFCSVATQAQEMNATVTIDAQQTGQPNFQVFRTLETQLTEFINNTSWSDNSYKAQERIDANFTLIINSFDGDSFTGSLQVQAARPIFGSTYSSPIYNYNDKAMNFVYKEFENLTFNTNTYDSNLVAVIVYHIYTILGLDADSFSQGGGDSYFQIAKQIVNTAATSNFAGWKATDGLQSRYRYNDALLSNVYKEFHEAMYQYHRLGLDLMHDSQKEGKQGVIDAIATLKSINDRRPNSFLVRTFFDAKSDEIASIFSGGPSLEITSLIDNLNKLAPTKRSAWNSIKY
ncbi:hypothetical protein SCB49_00897 [unidentified eubacterium SCB49]|nr:hypothetical protein SCB49_00897 [unidentified eubacterium SCB49]